MNYQEFNPQRPDYSKWTLEQMESYLNDSKNWPSLSNDESIITQDDINKAIANEKKPTSLTERVSIHLHK